MKSSESFLFNSFYLCEKKCIHSNENSNLSLLIFYFDWYQQGIRYISGFLQMLQLTICSLSFIKMYLHLIPSEVYVKFLACIFFIFNLCILLPFFIPRDEYTFTLIPDTHYASLSIFP